MKGVNAGGVNSASAANASSQSIRYHKKNSRNRHEPYMDTSGALSLSANLSSLFNQQGSPPFKARHRELSFSGTNSTSMNQQQTSVDRYNIRNHRGSEPNPLELIYANL
jgi:hypothetical protein